MSDDKIKEAFIKAKEDIFDLQSQIYYLHQEIEEIKRTLNHISEQTQSQSNPTDRQITPTDNLDDKALKPHYFNTSTGNEGVPTDRQTDQQTDRHIQKFAQVNNNPLPKVVQSSSTTQIEPHTTQNPTIINTIDDKSSTKTLNQIDRLEKVSQILESLDDIKKDLRSKFKKLTNQEMIVFSTIYQLEEEGNKVDYPLLATKLSLSESSARDYVLKITKKGVPIEKFKEKNKKILLSISKEFKKLASLQTILKLREL